MTGRGGKWSSVRGAVERGDFSKPPRKNGIGDDLGRGRSI